jgi:MoxR-like ATPase
MTTARPKRRRKMTEGNLATVQQLDPHVDLRSRLQAMRGQLNEAFVERDQAIVSAIVALLTGMNYLLVGPRGTAKTALTTCIAKHIEGATYYSTLLGSFTTVSDLIGRIDLAALQRGEERRHTEGKLLDCDIANLDEVLKASDGVLNNLLGILSDNRDFDGQPTKLWAVGSATNWPEVKRRSDRIAALYDRFHIKVPVTAVSAQKRIEVLRSARELGKYTPKEGTKFTLSQLKNAASQVRNVEIDAMLEEILCAVIERFHKEGIEVSDRKFGQWQRALQALAWLDGRQHVNLQDLNFVAFMSWEDAEHIAVIRSIVSTIEQDVTKNIVKELIALGGQYKTAINLPVTKRAADQIDQLLDQTTTRLTSIAQNVARLGLTELSKADIVKHMGELKQSFQALYNKRFGG